MLLVLLQVIRRKSRNRSRVIIWREILWLIYFVNVIRPVSGWLPAVIFQKCMKPCMRNIRSGHIARVRDSRWFTMVMCRLASMEIINRGMYMISCENFFQNMTLMVCFAIWVLPLLWTMNYRFMSHVIARIADDCFKSRPEWRYRIAWIPKIRLLDAIWPLLVHVAKNKNRGCTKLWRESMRILL